MNPVPARPKIYHITHVKNLPAIVAAKRLWSDAERVKQLLGCELVGMSEIKKRRLEELPVSCHPDTRVGEYVPFYFCPRSIMLYLLHRGNHPGITYREGQQPIVHLQADLHDVVAAADGKGKRWAFTTTNAGARYATFYASLKHLGEVNWQAVEATDFRPAPIKEGKQAEFLIFRSFPWSLVEKVGVANPSVLKQVETVLGSASHQPSASVERGWYY